MQSAQWGPTNARVPTAYDDQKRAWRCCGGGYSIRYSVRYSNGVSKILMI